VNWGFGLATGSYGLIDANVGDILTFVWTGTHNVNIFASKTAYTNCDFTTATSYSSTPGVTYTVVTLPVYFGCSISDHCSAGGMKLSVSVIGTPTSSTSVNGAFGVADIASVGLYMIVASMLAQLLLCLI